LIGIEQLHQRRHALVQGRSAAGDCVDEAAGGEPDLVGVAFLARKIADGDGLCGARTVEHGHRVDQMLLGQSVLNGPGNAIVFAACAGADDEFDVADGSPRLARFLRLRAECRAAYDGHRAQQGCCRPAPHGIPPAPDWFAIRMRSSRRGMLNRV
jgi:hypothetical protein